MGSETILEFLCNIGRELLNGLVRVDSVGTGHEKRERHFLGRLFFKLPFLDCRLTLKLVDIVTIAQLFFVLCSDSSGAAGTLFEDCLIM